MTEKNAAYYIEKAKYYKLTTAPEAPCVVRRYEVISGTSEMEVLERVLILLDKTGIPYSHSNFIIYVGTVSRSCTIEIYRNIGKHAKTHNPTSLKVSTILPDTNTFIVSQWDTTRYFGGLFCYIVENYSAEEIRPFTREDLNYGLYYPEDVEMELATKFAKECETIAVGGLTKEEVAILLQQPIEED